MDVIPRELVGIRIGTALHRRVILVLLLALISTTPVVAVR